MTLQEFASAFLDDAPVGVVLSDADLARPGPTILYANPAFARLTGRDLSEIVGHSPRFMQGRETLRSSLDAFRRTLAAGERFHGYLTNYRGDGSKYRVEIDCRPLSGPDGAPAAFLSFQRAVVRRLGRPNAGPGGRYEPTSVSHDSLTPALRALGAFDV